MAEGHLTTHEVERLAAGLLAPERAAFAQGHLPRCEDCRTRAGAAEKERESFLVRNPPALRAAELLEKRPRFAPWFGAFAAAAALLVLLPAALFLVQDVREKGAEARVGFTVHRPSTGQSFPGRSGDRFQPGDVFSLEVVSGRGALVAVYSLSSGGLQPLYAGASADVPKRTLVLDESVEPERLVVVVSEKAIGDAVVKAAAAEAVARAGGVEALGTLELPGAEVRMILVRKEKPLTK